MTSTPIGSEADAQHTIWFVAAFASVVEELEQMADDAGDPFAATELIRRLVSGCEHFGFSDVATAGNALVRCLNAAPAEPDREAPSATEIRADLKRLCKRLDSWARAHRGARVGSTTALTRSPRADRRSLHLLAAGDSDVVGLNRQLTAAGWTVTPLSSRAQLEIAVVLDTPDVVLIHGALKGAVEVVRMARERLELAVRVIYLCGADDLEQQFAAVHAGASGCLSADLSGPELLERFSALLGIFHQEEARVLVVSDNPARGRRLQDMLEVGGCRNRLLAAPGEVLSALLAFRPELLLVDLTGPGLSGLEFGAVVRQHAGLAGLPFVYLQAPPTDGDKRLAGLAAGSDDFVGSDVDDRYLLHLVKSRIMVARKLVTLSAEDPLTGLLARDAFQRQFELMVGMLSRSGGSLAVAAVEVDGLLAINREYGHGAGDLVLNRVAGAFSKRLRSSDSLSRYVSGRFVMALPGADIDDATRVVDEVRARLQVQPIPLGGAELSYTTSAGIAGYRFGKGHGEVPLYAAQLVESAARALDKAREQGGGCSVVDTGT